MTEFAITAKNKQFIPFEGESEKAWEKPFFFIQCADTQFGMDDIYNKKKPNPGWDDEIKWSKQLVADVRHMKPKPRFVVVCGDLLDAMPTTNLNTRKLQEKDFKDVFKELDVPLVCVCGNHDVGDRPTPESVAEYRNSFGDDYFSFWCGGVFFIVLNSQFYEDRSLVKEIALEQELWLDKQLEVAQSVTPKHTVVFQHIPPFLYSPLEKNQYFNFDLALRQKFLSQLRDSGVRYLFCGHYHRNAGGFHKDLEVVVTSAVSTQLGDDDHGYRIVNVFDDEITHKYYSLGAAPVFQVR